MANNEMFVPLTESAGCGRSTSGGTGGDWTPIAPVPSSAQAAPAGHPTRGKPTATFAYRSAAGELLGYVYRFKDADTGKVYIPVTWCQSGDRKRHEWRWKGWVPPRPLYGLDRLAARPSATVVVAEGEKAADAVARLLPDHVAITSPNGSKSAGKADWTPTRGRHVVIWPDADEPGAGYAAAVVKALNAAGAASVSVIDPPAGVKVGWDAADAIGEGWNQDRALSLVRGAKSIAGAAGEAEPGGRRGPSARDSLMALLDGCELWHTPDRDAYASVPIAGHMEHWPIKGETFRDWLSGEYYRRHGHAPGEQTIKDSLSTMVARARHDGLEHPIFLRTGKYVDAIYVDLADERWRAVRIDADGWEVVDQPPVKFRRTFAMRALPEPKAEASIDELRDLVNCATEGDFKLLIAWLIAAFNPELKCPILAINGEQGSAKSTLSTLLRNIVDPNSAPIRAVPRDEDDFFVGAFNSHVAAFDNLSEVAPWLSDALCRLSTGAGFSKRRLFTDTDELVLQLKRPVILNGIPDLARRADLASRCIAITLPAIPEDRRRTDEEGEELFKRRWPDILGALFDGVSSALRRRSSITLEALPRMGSFALWVTAAEEGLGWKSGEFLEAYVLNRTAVVDTTIEADPVAGAVRDLIRDADWEGTPTQLLPELAALVPDAVLKTRIWPTAQTLRGRLRRLAADMRELGVIMDLDLRAATRDRARLISLRMPRRS